MRSTQKSLAICLTSAALLGSLSASAQTGSAPTTPQTFPARSFTTDLATASLAKDGVTQPTTAQLTAARNSIQAQRDSGMGWGQIANALGLNLGAVVSAANRVQPAEAKTRQSNNKPEKAERSSSSGGGTSGHGGGGGGGRSK